MKRKFALQILGALMALAAVLTFYPAETHANQVIPVFVNGGRVAFQDMQPVIRGDRTLVPMRGVFEHMGFYVQWNPNTHTATMTRPGDVITVRTGDSFFTINGIRNFPDVPPQIIGDRFMLPIRAIAEATGAHVGWDYVAGMVIITTQDTPPPPPPVAPPVITTSTLPGGNVGQNYNQTLVATGTGVTWNVQSGNLPTGLQLNANTGAITGSPTAAGTFTFTVRASNNGGQATATFTIVVQQQASSITLPNRRVTDAERNAWITEYRNLGGATANELEVIRLINIERANHGLVQVQLDERLMMAARFFAQQANDLRGLYTGSHNFGPYATNPNAQHGASANVAAAFGGNLRWNGGNWFSSGTMSAEALVTGWMNSTGHRNYILSPEHRFIGMGQFPGGISYLFMSDTASTVPGQQFTVTFNANGGTGTMAEQTFQQGVSQALRANTFTRTGHTFAGWRSTSTGAVQYNNQQSITVSANRTLYAVWTTGHTVTFNANGGTGTMAAQVFQPGVSQALRANTFTRAGHSFVGWRNSPSGTAQYNNQQNITVNANRTLFAVWTTGHTVTFNANGGTGTMANQTFQPGVAQALRANTFTRAGHTFAGWRSTATGAVQYTNQQSITVNANRTLFAVWTPTQQFTVTFNSNGGTGTMAAQTFQSGVAQALRANTFTRAGHTFAGWRSTATGVVQYTNQQSITVTANRTLFAVWTPAQQFTVTFNANGGTGTMAAQTFQPGVAQTLRANTFTRAGHTFAGWSTTAGGGVQYTNQQNITVTANRTLFAVWTAVAQTVTVTFNGNGHTSGSTAAQQFTSGVAQNLNANGFNRTGHAFAGWSSTAAGAVQYTNGQSITVTASRTLYAVWTATNVAVPNVIGQAYVAARTALENVGFTVNVTNQHSNDPAGTVIAQTPAGGAQHPYNGAITITVSLGQAMANVPSVAGFTQATAEGALAEFSVAVVFDYSSAIPAGSVISQSLVAGTQHPIGTAITIVVSNGPEPD